MKAFGNSDDDGILELVLVLMAFVCVVAGLIEIVNAMIEGAGVDAEAKPGKAAKAEKDFVVKEHSMMRGIYFIAASVPFLWMKKMLDLLANLRR